jgi:hypothetical protein
MRSLRSTSKRLLRAMASCSIFSEGISTLYIYGQVQDDVDATIFLTMEYVPKKFIGIDPLAYHQVNASVSLSSLFLSGFILFIDENSCSLSSIALLQRQF